MSNAANRSFIWFLTGLSIGVIAGVLYAPDAGCETRKALLSRAEGSREFVRERARRARQQATEWAKRNRNSLDYQKQRFRLAYMRGRQAYRKATRPEAPNSAA
jgi:gas vesicle protein